MLYLWIFGDNIEDSMGHCPLPASSTCSAAPPPRCAGPRSTRSPRSRWWARAAPFPACSAAISCCIPAPRCACFIFLGIFVTVAHVPALIVLGVWFVAAALQRLAMATAGRSAASPSGRISAASSPACALISLFKRRVRLLESRTPRLPHGAAPRPLGLTADAYLSPREGGCEQPDEGPMGRLASPEDRRPSPSHRPNLRARGGGALGLTGRIPLSGLPPARPP